MEKETRIILNIFKQGFKKKTIESIFYEFKHLYSICHNEYKIEQSSMAEYWSIILSPHICNDTTEWIVLEKNIQERINQLASLKSDIKLLAEDER